MKKNSASKKTPLEKGYQRYNLIYKSIVLACIVAIIVAYCLTGLFWGSATLAFALWSFWWYENGATEMCVDEYEYAYPYDGFRTMIKSWPWFAILTAIAYLFYQVQMSWILA